MIRRSLTVASLLAAALIWCSEKCSGDETRINGHTFTLPAGFSIARVAGPPLVDRPIVADFDASGRLFVADSSGTNDKVEKQLAEKPHRIVRLEDGDGDGVFDKRTVFADKMMFPEGVMWFGGSLYVAAPPSIWKLTDTDGDGIADSRQEWFQGKTLTGCANDLHGPYRGPDGWIYWCKGAFAEQRYERPGHKPLVTKAAHIFRCRPDGGGIEPVMTGGMDNPVDVVFTEGGERIFTTTFLQHPGGGLRDGLIHAVYGGVYGKEHNVLDGHPRTGNLMPVLTHMGAAAPCGLAAYTAPQFGAEFRGDLFAAAFNMRKITRHTLVPAGASFATRDEDFLVSDNLDFHPTDVLTDADGSLVVVDTGGWYKLCCPTSQLHKPDVLGAVYRVRRTTADRPNDPRGASISWSTIDAQDLVRLLGDPRPAVCDRAVEVLAQRGEDAVRAIQHMTSDNHSALAHRNAVWTLTRIDHCDARALVRTMLADPDETVRQCAMHSISLWRDRHAIADLLSQLTGTSLHNRRAAAEALGRIGDKSAVMPLLEAAAAQADRTLEHSIVFALVEIAHAAETKKGLAHANSRVKRAALIALDQMHGGGLDPKQVAPLLGSNDEVLRETAMWLAARRPNWGPSVSEFLAIEVHRLGRTSKESQELEDLLARFARDGAVQKLLMATVAETELSSATRHMGLRAMARSGLKELPAEWSTTLEKLTTADNSEFAVSAIAVFRAIPPAKAQAANVTARLAAIGMTTDLAAAIRLAALAAIPSGLTRVEPAMLAFLCASLETEVPVQDRAAAAEVLAKATLAREQLLELADLTKSIGPLELDRLLGAFERTSDETVGLRLVAGLAASSSLSSLRVDALRSRLVKFGPQVAREAETLYSKLNVDLTAQRAKLDGLQQSLTGGDVRRGQLVFHSAKAACNACHAIGYLGGNVGPDLTRIAQIRSPRDLLESIVFPNASFVRSYEPVVVATRDGRVQNGLVRQNGPDELVLATGVRQETRIAQSEVEEIRPSTVSIMPSGLDQQLSVQELADLMAFLATTK